MATLTVFSGTADGYVEEGHATYATMQAGGNGDLGSNAFSFITVGQRETGGAYFGDEGFIGFDTSALTAAATISAAVLSLWFFNDQSTNDFTFNARLYDWGASLTEADWRTPSDLGGLTLAASVSTAGIGTGAYTGLTESGTNLQTGVNKTGTTNLVLASSRFESSTAPGSGVNEYINISSADEAGTTQDPKLVVTYTLPATRFYFSASNTPTPSITPSFAGWTRTTEGARRRMSVVKDGTTLANKTIWANGTAAANATALAYQLISDPMAAGIGFSTADAIKGVIRCLESSTGDNIDRTAICLKVIAADGTTLQATLWALGSARASNEWDTGTAESRFLADGDVLTANYTTVLGDRLVLEVGGQASAAGGTTVTGTMRFGSSAGADLAENETTTTDNDPWFEIGRAITFVEILTPAIDTVAFTGQAPTLQQVKNLAAGAPAAITFTGFAPTLVNAKVLTPDPDTVVFTGYAPSLVRTQRLAPDPDTITFTGYEPTLLNATILTPGAASVITWTGYAPVIPTSDMVVEVQLSNLSGDTDEECGVVFRFANTDNFLAAYVDAGDNLVHLAKFETGSETDIATFAWTPADTAEIRVIAQGDRLRVWVNFVMVIDEEDATFNTATRAGLFSRSTTAVLFENFYAQGL